MEPIGFVIPNEVSDLLLQRASKQQIPCYARNDNPDRLSSTLGFVVIAFVLFLPNPHFCPWPHVVQ
jgi:hypothetical protein